ncbi:MAG: hypothetical protein ACLS9B_08745 [Coprococcus comes]|jgi:hypothetical protein|nr:MAG TPA: Protein of unknown function (DUF551) [Caudoviricetes sp.]
MRYTEYHTGKAVIKDKNKLSEAMEKLARYEDAEEKDRLGQWIPCSERMPDIARYEENDEGGTFYPGDDEKPYSSYGIFVNAWMPLPKPYKQNDEGAEK